jgi:two-component system, chemotaxis family, sensor kinase CheA
MQFDEILARSREIFRQEAADLLVELEAALLELEADCANPAIIDRVFRVMHTLKGSGATSGYPELSTFVHHVEDVYNAAREGRLRIDSGIVGLTLEICDAVKGYLDSASADAPAILAQAGGVLERLRRFLPAAAGTTPASAESTPNTPPVRRFLIRFRPHPEVFQNGTDPGMFLDDLRALGSCMIRSDTSRLPPFDEMDPELCYLGWEIELTTAATATAVREVFMFIEEDRKSVV